MQPILNFKNYEILITPYYFGSKGEVKFCCVMYKSRVIGENDGFLYRHIMLNEDFLKILNEKKKYPNIRILETFCAIPPEESKLENINLEKEWGFIQSYLKLII